MTLEELLEELRAPATDHALVCKWTESGELWATECGCSYAGFVSLFVRYRFVRDAYCPHCRQPIKFTEAAHDEGLKA